MSFLQALTLFAVMVSLAALPSSSVALVVARSATAGVSNGIAVSIGVVLGDLLFVLLAILGLTAVAELMGGFFTILKIAGGLYLIWLGLALLKANGEQLSLQETGQGKRGLLVSLSAGFFLTLGDVKAIIFYASLFPFFIDLSSASAFDYGLVVVITVVSVGSVKVLYAAFASKVAFYMQQKKIGAAPQKVAGGLMLGVGSYVTFKA